MRVSRSLLVHTCVDNLVMDMDGPLGAALASGMDTEYTLSAALSTHPDIYLGGWCA